MKIVFAIIGALTAMLLAAQAAAQEKYPARPIQLVVPFAAGGSTDVIGRRIAAKLEPLLGTSVVVENRPGASGTLGATVVARAKPDGYTILLGSDQVVATGALQNLAYDGMNDFVPLAIATITPIGLVSGPSMPAQSITDAIAALKADPARYSYGSPGEGSIINLAGELFKRAAGVEMVHVPYRGAAPAMNDLMGGHIPLMVATIGSAVEQVRSGSVRMLVTFTEKRNALTPDVPTAAEIGLPGVVVSSFSGLFVHKDTPPAILETLRAAADKVVRDPDFRSSLETLGIEAVNDPSPAAAAKIVKDASDKFVSVFKSSGIKVN